MFISERPTGIRIKALYPCFNKDFLCTDEIFVIHLRNGKFIFSITKIFSHVLDGCGRKDGFAKTMLLSLSCPTCEF